MPPFALLVTSAAVVLSALAVQPLSDGIRPLIGAGLLTIAAYAASPACRPRDFRLLLVAGLVAGAMSAHLHAHDDAIEANAVRLVTPERSSNATATTSRLRSTAAYAC